MGRSSIVNIRNSTEKEIDWPIRLCLGIGLCQPAFQNFKKRVLLPLAINGTRAKIQKLKPWEVREKIFEVWERREELGDSKKGGVIFRTRNTPWGDVYMVVGVNRKESEDFEEVVITFLDKEVAIFKIKDDKIRQSLVDEDKKEEVAIAV